MNKENTVKMAIKYNYNFPQLARESGFKLRQYKDGPLDWRLIGCLEVERILREQSLEQIDGVVHHLSEVPLGSILDTNILDSGIAKYFNLAQFSIQYLLFCRTFLDETVRDLRESLIESETEVNRMKKSLEEAKNEVLALNKKITQMEAIHEVIYPCHLCTKNFISNEALNVHIGRRHPNGRSITELRRSETPVGSSNIGNTAPFAHHERDNDRNLINAIKLELEIKQLKERLNLAERKFKERDSNNEIQQKNNENIENNENKTNVITAAKALTTRDIGIQGNLIEEKEKDETILRNAEAELKKSETEQIESKEHLIKLHKKLEEFEEWQNIQKGLIEQGMIDINQKLKDIEVVLGQTKIQSIDQLPQHSNENLNCTTSPSMEQLERVLTQKLSELSKTSAKKLEEVINHMEQNYNKKLNEFKNELKLRVELDKKNQSVEINDPAYQIVRPQKDVKESGNQEISKSIEIVALPMNQKENEKKEVENNKNVLVSLSSTSNRTFIKSDRSVSSLKEPEGNGQVLGNEQDAGSSTDISESLSDDDETELSSESAIEFREENIKKITPMGKTNAYKQRKSKTADERMKSITEKDKKETSFQPRKPTSLSGEQKRFYFQRREFTRCDAKKMSKERLASFGFDSQRTKTLSRASYQKLNAELIEHRSYLKKKYPDFMVARNKVRKFVEKLCSTKLPESAKAVLQNTQPQRPSGIMPKQHPLKTSQDENFDSDLDLGQAPVNSTPLKASDLLSQSQATEFTERLDRLLKTPNPHMSERSNELNQVPIPVPRKRVMFNTFIVSDKNDMDENSIK